MTPSNPLSHSKRGEGAQDAIHLLSRDCRDHVFDFLSLFDCLRYAETSRASLEHVIAEVDRRRHEQFLVRPCEEYACGLEKSSPLNAIRTSALPPGDTLLTPNSVVGGSENDGAAPAANDSGRESFLYRIPSHVEILHAVYSPDVEVPETSTWFTLPSVMERIEGLYRKIPISHPFNDDLKNLVSDLKRTTTAAQENATGNNGTLLKRFSSITRAHRLHASLLRRCTVELNPDPYVENFNPRGSDDETLTVTLERYMGDVLAASCLIGHSYHNGNGHDDNFEYPTDYDGENYGSKTRVVVEGGPSFGQWTDHLASFGSIRTRAGEGANPSAVVDGTSSTESTSGPDRTDETTSTSEWYQCWVFLHSVLLQSSPFTIHQAQHLTFGPVSGVLEPIDLFHDPHAFLEDPNNAARQLEQLREQMREHPEYRPWFLPSITYSCMFPLNELMTFLQRLRGLFPHNLRDRMEYGFGNFEVTLNHFGPLGPAFRGRDRVATHAMLPHEMSKRLLENHLASWYLLNMRRKPFLGAPQGQVDDIKRWLSDSDRQGVVPFMKLLQEQSQTTRPMTVQPPLVTIRVTKNTGINVVFE